MTKTSRTTLFFFLAILFALLGPSTIFYSQGYRIDFKTKKIVQTGAIHLKTEPGAAKIYLNGKLCKETGRFFSSVLIQDLLPKIYKIEIKKEDYHPWEKHLQVEEKQVTEAKNITLIPQNPNFTIIKENVEKIFFSPLQTKAIFSLSTENLENKENQDLKFYDLQKETENDLVEEKSATLRQAQDEIKKERIEILDVSFSLDSKRAILKIKDGNNLKYCIADTEKETASLKPIIIFEQIEKIQKIDFLPQNHQKLIFSQENELFILDLTEETIIPLFASPNDDEPISQYPDEGKDIAAWTISGKNLYYFNNKGLLFKMAFEKEEKERITGTNFSFQESAKYEIIIHLPSIFLKENDSLYIFNENSYAFEKFFEPVKTTKISMDQKKILYFNEHEIWILYPSPCLDQIQREKGDKIFIARFSEKIGKCFWLTPDYLIFNTGNKIKIAEIDNRDKINIINLAEFKNPQISWNQDTKTLYVLSNKILFKTNGILP